MQSRSGRAFFAGASLVTASCLIFGAGAPAFAATNNDGSRTVSIATFTDLHGHLEMAPNLAYQIDQIKKSNPDTIVASDGDSIGGSAYISSVQKDEPTLQVLKVFGVQVSAAGNHEYDKGYKQDLAVGARVNKESNFPYLAANVTGADPAALPPYTIITEPNGLKVAFVGTSPISSPHDIAADSFTNQGLGVTDPVAAVDKYAAQLKDGDQSNGEADVVIALVHDDAEIAAKVGPNVDAAVGGHTHVKKDLKTASGAPVIEPDHFGSLLGRLDITVTKDHKVTVASKMIPIENSETNPNAPANAAALKIYKDAAAYAESTNKPIAKIIGKSLLAKEPGAESTAVNMVADGFLAWGKKQPQGADFGYQNSGGTRADMDPNEDGTVTVVESGSVQPFNNKMGTIEVTGAQVIAMIEKQWSVGVNGAEKVNNAGFSRNVSYLYDPTAPVGSKVFKVTIDGKDVDPAKTYTVATTSYLLTANLKDGKNKIVSNDIDLASFNAWLGSVSPYTVDQGQRGVGVNLKDFEVGTPATLKLSSLSMTADEEKPTEAILLDQNGKELGRAKVDNTADGNETGKATITFTLPKGTPNGKYLFTVKAGATTAVVPVSIWGSVEATPAPSASSSAPAVAPAPSAKATATAVATAPAKTAAPTAAASHSAASKKSTASKSAVSKKSAASKKSTSSLPRTGAEVLGVAGAAFAMLAAGALIVARRAARR